jgi:hypothetical protein
VRVDPDAGHIEQRWELLAQLVAELGKPRVAAFARNTSTTNEKKRR